MAGLLPVTTGESFDSLLQGPAQPLAIRTDKAPTESAAKPEPLLALLAQLLGEGADVTPVTKPEGQATGIEPLPMQAEAYSDEAELAAQQPFAHGLLQSPEPLKTVELPKKVIGDASAPLADTMRRQGSEGPAATLIDLVASVGKDASSMSPNVSTSTANPVFAPVPMPAAFAVSAAPNLPAALPPVPMDVPDWPERLGAQIHWRLGAGVQEARIEISPQHLGTVDVHLSMDDAGLRVHLTAAHAQTRELLQNELPRLKELLQQGGVQLADAQVGREPTGRHSRGQPQSVLQSSKGQQSEAATSQPISWRRSRGLLDDYA